MSERPSLVIGVGGYASVSTMLAAFCLRPFLLLRLAIIEQNSVPGLANRVLSKLFIQAYSPFKSPGFRGVDLPIRMKILAAVENCRKPDWPPKVILVMGGSQGAKGLNQQWMKMIPQLKEGFPGISILHQTGSGQDQYVQAAYQDLEVKAEAFAFSDAMEEYYNKADLIIARSGALSLFEILEFKRPVIFVPYPFATDDHQAKNARAVQKGNWIIPENQFLWPDVRRLLVLPHPSVPSKPQSSPVSWAQILR